MAHGLTTSIATRSKDDTKVAPGITVDACISDWLAALDRVLGVCTNAMHFQWPCKNIRGRWPNEVFEGFLQSDLGITCTNCFQIVLAWADMRRLAGCVSHCTSRGYQDEGIAKDSAL